MSWFLRVSILLLLPSFILTAEEIGGWREWTSSTGTKVEGKILSRTADSITLERKDNGTKLTVKLSQLSKSDQEFIYNLPEPEVVKGETKIEGTEATPGNSPQLMACKDGKWNYYLYLPKEFHTGRKWPIMFVMSPSGGKGGKTLSRYIPGADRLGIVLALSVESKNQFADSDSAMESMADDAFSRLPLIEDLAFSTGMSGGSRMAYLLAERDSRIAGVIACGSGDGVYLKEAEFRDANLRKSTFVYSLLGTTCFNRTEASASHETFPDDYRLQFFPGAHTWAPEPFISPAMARVYGEGLLNSKCADIVSLKSTYLKTMVTWINEMKDKEPWEAAQWISFLRKFKPDAGIADKLSEISKQIASDPRTATGTEAEQEVRKFAHKYFTGESAKSGLKQESETLATKYADLPHGEIFKLLGSPESKP